MYARVRQGVIVWALGCSLAMASAALPPGVAADHLQSGELSNGFKYLILPHESATGGLSLRLLVRVGSGDEQDAELGYAHFVEHMAFSGSRHHPAGTLTGFFQHLGLQLGADLNANTTLTATVYKADLPPDHADHVSDVLQLFHDYADGLRFEPTQVERERAVVLSELAARDTAAAKNGDAIAAALYAGTLAARRNPAGSAASIRAATPEALRGFYERTYRAGRMTLIVVGAVNPKAVVTQIEAEFGALASRPPRASPMDRLPLRPRALTEHVMVTPAAAGASVLYANVLTPGSADNVGEQLNVDRAIAGALVMRRLQERREKSGGAAIGTAAELEWPVLDGRFRAYTATVDTTLSSWREGVGMIATEIQRVRAGDFTDAEMNEAAAALQKMVEDRTAAMTAAASPALANQLTTTCLSGREWVAPEEEKRSVAAALKTLDNIRVMAAARAIFPPNAGHLFVMLPQPVAMAAPLARAAWVAGANRRPTQAASTAAAPAAAPPLAFAYTSFGTAGTLGDRRREADLDLELGQFGNHVAVNVRRSEAEPGRFTALVRLGRGLVDVVPERPGLVTIASALVNVNAPRRHKRTEIGRLLALHDVQCAFRSDEGCGMFLIAGPARELQFALGLVAAYVSDLDLAQANDQLVRGEILGWEHTAGAQPAVVAVAQALRLATGNDTRFEVIPDASMLTPARFEETKRWLVERWFNGPIEVGIVGDVPPDDAFAAAAATLGALPARAALGLHGDHERLAAHPVAGVKTVSAPVRAGTAVATAVWPVHQLDHPATFYAAQLAADVVGDRLRKVLREEKGATYAPAALLWRSREQPDFGFFTAALTLDPAHAPELAKSMIAIADDLAKSGARADDVERLRQPRLAAASAQLHQNLWWLVSVVGVAQSRPDAIAEARAHATAYERVTLDDVNAALRSFAQPHASAVVAVPASGGTGSLTSSAAAALEPTGN